MEEGLQARMRMNLARGIACLAVGAVVIAAIEVLWDHVGAGSRSHPAEDCRNPGGESPLSGSPGYQDMMAFAFDDDAAAIGSQELPAWFIEECFDARVLGDVHCSVDGRVVGITSCLTATELFDECVGGLTDNGWLQVRSGNPLRCTFMKEVGSPHWLFLDVNQVLESGVAVIVAEEGDGS